MIVTCLGDCTYKVSSQYKEFKLTYCDQYVWKNTSGFMGETRFKIVANLLEIVFWGAVDKQFYKAGQYQS